MLISKPKYIRKYDYQRYFYRPKEQWFLPTSLVIDTLKSLTIKEYEKAHMTYIEDEDDEEQETDSETDSYERFKEAKELLMQEKRKDLDQEDPKIFEGNIIDKKSKEFMISNYDDCEVYDFDEHPEYLFDVDKAAKKTIELLTTKENIIMFQPTFIYKDKAMARPDGFVKHGNVFTLLETKGTTTVKAVHLVDMTYQAIVVNETIQKLFKKQIDIFKLCIVDYTKAKKGDVPLKFTEYAALQKGGFTNGKLDTGVKKGNIQKYSDEFIDLKSQSKDASIGNAPFSDYIYDKINNSSKTKTADNLKEYQEMNNIDNFDEIIDELYLTPINLNPTFEPNSHLFSWFKNNDYYPELKAYYAYNPNYFMLQYSGYILKSKEAISLYEMNASYEMVESEIEKNKMGRNYLMLCKKHNFSLGGYSPFMQDEYQKYTINKKKVYFDFESINLATRVIDDTLPFMQTCNQVSVIFDHGDKNLSQSNNVVIDPLTFTLDSYKEIIDAILPFPNDLAKSKEYIYIVYNKGFECSRLKEMKALFYASNKSYAIEYGKKCDIINEKIVDLADLFDLRKDCGICIEKIKGFYSIKKVLPIVGELCPQIFEEVKCKDYKKLTQIKNGGEAQKESTKRFFNLLTQEKWDETVRNLKIYCENDVRAMIAVEYMVGYILSEKK